VTLLTHWEGEPVTVWQQLWEVPVLEAHQRLGSTNDRAGELAREGAMAFTTVLAEEQTSGRGRGGKVWRSPPGTGLWLSTLLRQDGPVPLTLPLLVGLAAARAIEAVHPDVHVGIKWPNDLFLDGRKIGGVLCESMLGPNATGSVVAGVGLNLRQPPEGFPSDIASTAASVEGVSRQPVRRSALASRLMAELHRLCGPSLDEVTASLIAEFGPRDVLMGHDVLTAQGPGTARGIDSSGALILERADAARVRVISGSVQLA